MADIAGHRLAAGLRARARACLAHLQPWNLDLGLEPAGGVLQRDLQLVLEVLAAPGAAAAPAAAAGEEALEDVLEERAEALAEVHAAQTGDGPEAIVLRALVGIGEHGVGLARLLEAVLGLLVAGIAIGVVLHGELAIRLLELRVAGRARDAEDLVVVAGHAYAASSSGATATATWAARSTRSCSR